MNLEARVSGRITDDPALKFQAGQQLHFAPVRVGFDSEAKGSWLQMWQSFQGVLLFLRFGGEDDRIDGSAVLVAPGIALCATHVVEPALEKLLEGKSGLLGAGIADSGLLIWRVHKVTPVPGTDLTILGLVYTTELPENHLFHLASITTRLPRIGERVLVCGFKPDGNVSQVSREFIASGSVLVCAGLVTQHFLNGRDSVSMPWSVIEIDCPSWGGMSGGPVFDERGAVVGVLSSSFESEGDDGPSYGSLLWPALGTLFEGGWPEVLFQGRRSLLDLDPRLCAIENREAVEVIDGGGTLRYHAWS